MKYLNLINLDNRDFINSLFNNFELSDKYDDLKEEFYSQFQEEKKQIIRSYEINDFTYILHLTSTKEKKWRITTLIKNIPTSHIILNSYVDGIKYLIEQIVYKNFLNKQYKED